MNTDVSQKDWTEQREKILANMQFVMGQLPDDSKRVPLEVQVIETEELSRVTRMKISYVPERGDRISAYLLVPRELNGPAPAMVCLHGTGESRGKTAGL